MTIDLLQVREWIASMAALIDKNADPEPRHYNPFLQEPQLAFRLVDMLESLDEKEPEEERAYFSASVFALDLCVAQLQSALENGQKNAGKTLQQLMDHMAAVIRHSKHSLTFWLPVLNAFYDVHVELSPTLREAFLELAGQEEEDISPDDEMMHLNAIREMIAELSDLSAFDIAENFFAQSYAMPEDFFIDLVMDLYNIEEGQDIALLMLLHPKPAVREVVVSTIGSLINHITLSSISLSRLQAIKSWYAPVYQDQLNQWIKIQRKKGVVYAPHPTTPAIRMKASEVDGSGSQGVFVHLKKNRKNRLCGLLLKQDIGMKDVWITPAITAKDVERYYGEAFDESVTLRSVEMDYLQQITNHFLAVTLEQGGMPDLHLLELQETLGIAFSPQKLDLQKIIDELGVQIIPFTQTAMEASFKRSKSWINHKRFTESWYLENAHIDKLVNRCCTFVEGVRICDIEHAIEEVFTNEFECHREKWLFHFLWTTLWLKSKASKTEKSWHDTFFIAYAITQGEPLKNIALMQEICRHTVINSVETMKERRTHLNQE